MRSTHADYFCHDEDVEGYDLDVQNTDDPIRTAYDDVLDWVVRHADIKPTDHVLDLGSGTGNTSKRITACASLTCVDVSEKMTAVARPKLAHLSNVTYVQSDILEYFDQPVGLFDVILSTYAIHHLTESEKPHLFAAIKRGLAPGGGALFGDLMFEDAAAQKQITQDCLDSGDTRLPEAFADEFFWHLDTATAALENLGFTLMTKRHSLLSWTIAASLEK